MKRFSTACLACLFLLITTQVLHADLKVGAAITDVTPKILPVLVNGGMTSRSYDTITTKVNARAIVLDDGEDRIAIVVVDSCMMPRPLLDDVKTQAEKKTGIKADRILISATHTHTAPASMGCLGTDADPAYVTFLRLRLVNAIESALENLEPAKVGFAVRNANKFTAVRRWIRRPDRIVEDPFGNLTVRANMHSGNNWDNVTGESGPEDPDLSLISFQSLDGRPIAVLANFSMHYFSGQRGINADYFGLYCDGMQERLQKKNDDKHPPFVGIMSHGCSGDIWRRDYTKPDEWNPKLTAEEFAGGLLDITMDAYKSVKYQTDADIAMAEARMELKYRVPDKQRLEWAQKIVAEMGDRLPKTSTEVYAREQIILHERQSTEIVVQGIRIGNIGIATTPNETYALTGMKIKLQSPLKHTMVIELANGGDGYIPPPEQHVLGGYNTWAARSAGLEVQAEPKITEAGLRMLEKASGSKRKLYKPSKGPLAEAIAAAKPVAWWRLDEFGGPRAVDETGNRHDGIFEDGVVFFLEGADSTKFTKAGHINRAAHFAGGRMLTRIPDVKDQYSVSLWIWNGLPSDAREVCGWMFSRDHNYGLGSSGDHLGIGGKAGSAGKLIFQHGNNQESITGGKTAIERWTWNHIVLVRDKNQIRVHLNGKAEPEIAVESKADFPEQFAQFFIGGRGDKQATWEGRLDEVALFNRALSPKDIAGLYSVK